MMPMRAVWFTAGLIALCLGVLGIALPILPTTPFVLLAAFAFARSSDSWHDWLCRHRVFGPVIDDWRRHGAIGRRAKIAGVVSMAAVFLLSLVMNAGMTVLAIQAVALTGAAAFVLSRPTSPGDKRLE